MLKHLINGVICLTLLLPGAIRAQDIEEPRIEKKTKIVIKGGWLGVEIENITPELKESKNLSVDKGAYVRSVVDDSPADSAGIEKGDVIVQFGKTQISDPTSLMDAVKKLEPGTMVDVVVHRGSEKKTVHARIADRDKGEKRIRARVYSVPRAPSVPRPPDPPAVFSWKGNTKSTYGLTIETLNEQLAEYFGAPNKKGILVKNVKKDSKADKAGFKAGDVIVRAGKKTIEKVGDFTNVFGAYDVGEKIAVEVYRKGERKTLTLEVAEDSSDSFSYRFFSHPGDFEFEFDGDGSRLFDGDIDIDVDLDIMRKDLEDSLLNHEEMFDNLRGDISRMKDRTRKAQKELQDSMKKKLIIEKRMTEI